jgi:hypothetical protein
MLFTIIASGFVYRYRLRNMFGGSEFTTTLKE